MLAGASAGPHSSGPEPRLTSAQSYEPWYAPSNFAIFGRPVKPRAALIAIMTASLPEFVKRTWSTLATRSTMSAARSISSAVGSGKDAPRASRRVAASVTAGCAWPCMSDV